MKRPTHIANELRDIGRMFSATKLQAELSKFTPVFQDGHVVFYDDSVVDVLKDKFRINKRKLARLNALPPVVVPEPIIVVEPTYSRLDRIEKMLEQLMAYLDLAAPDPVKV